MLTLGLVEIEPGYGVDGLGLVEIEPTQSIAGADGVQLVGFGQEEKPWYKRPLVLTAIGVGVVAAGTGAYMLVRRR
jgi:hypothetical protein